MTTATVKDVVRKRSVKRSAAVGGSGPSRKRKQVELPTPPTEQAGSERSVARSQTNDLAPARTNGRSGNARTNRKVDLPTPTNEAVIEHLRQPSHETRLDTATTVHAEAANGHDRSPSQTSEAISALRELTRRYNAFSKAKNAIQHQCRAYARTLLGFSWELPVKERAAITKKSRELADRVIAGKPIGENGDVAEAIEEYVLAYAPSFQRFDKLAKTTKKAMEATVEPLPVWTRWGKLEKGIGAHSIAKLIGEAGEALTLNVAKLEKRFGVAPPECYRVDTKEGGTAIAKPKARRSTLWNVGTSVIKAKNTGKYIQMYKARKEIELGRTKTNGHAERRAHRTMDQEILRDLWKAWKFGEAYQHDAGGGAA